MLNNIKELEELKAIVLDLHRSAGHLDGLIQGIEIGWEGMTDIEKEFYLKDMLQYRLNTKRVNGYEQLETKEIEVWNNLIDTVKKERP